MHQNFSLILILFLINIYFGKNENNEEYNRVIKYYNDRSLYCEGPVLHDVQTLKIFPRSEDFLRLKLVRSQKEILEDYANISVSGLPLSEKKKLIENFIYANFENESGIENWTPRDWSSKPALSKKVRDKNLAEFILELNTNWLVYGRNLKQDVSQNPKMYSFIDVSKPFFVSNSDEQEMCVWDSYWIVQGLLACDMYESARNIIENCLNMIQKIGHCPPRNRIYFHRRIAPPVLPIMMWDYMNRTNDKTILEKYLTLMVDDFHEWFRLRVAVLKNPFHIFLAAVEDTWPQLRPESYTEDLKNWNHQEDQLDMSNVFWEVDPVVKVISVKLTAITEYAARILADWASHFEYKAQAKLLLNISSELNYTLQELLKVDECWRDLHLDKGYLSPTPYSLTPVWTGLAGNSEGCHRLPIQPQTGPEAVISGQFDRWIGQMTSRKVQLDMIDTAVLLHMIEQRPQEIRIQKRIDRSQKKQQISMIVKLMCLVGLIKIFLDNIRRRARVH